MDSVEVVESGEGTDAKKDGIDEADALAAKTLQQMSTGRCDLGQLLPCTKGKGRRRSRHITLAGVIYARKQAELAGPTASFYWHADNSGRCSATATATAAPKRKRKSTAAAVEEELPVLSLAPSAVPWPPRTTNKKKRIDALNGALPSETELKKQELEAREKRDKKLRIQNKSIEVIPVQCWGVPCNKGIVINEGKRENKTMEKALEGSTKGKEVEQNTERRSFLLDLNLPPLEEEEPSSL